jgi:UDP-N-acetylmuramate dehydrogenase
MLNLSDLFGDRCHPAPAMRDLTTAGIGGPAGGMVVAHTAGELADAILLARRESVDYLVLGGGSNLLVADEGIHHLIIKNEVVGIECQGDQLTVSGGTVLQDLVDYTIRHGLTGMQKLNGIPGTVGGAIYGNAGAYGQTISESLIDVLYFDGEQVLTLAKSECHFSYRSSLFKEKRLTVLEARFRLGPADPILLAEEAEKVLRQRIVKYPPGLRCSGSFFKNVIAAEISPESLALVPEDKVLYGKIPAGYLLEQVGAKGRTLGDIWVSTASANLFVNQGEGKATDLLQLASELALRVRERYGIALEPEVQIVGLPSPFGERVPA